MGMGYDVEGYGKCGGGSDIFIILLLFLVLIPLLTGKRGGIFEAEGK
ncbi:MAG: hypothetical protein WAP98_09675 [Caldicoprobacterales bacterium]|jgi:hypothetical protein|nr:hypothetical protein [Clostridia bacterium]MDI9512718.1 hypothetical protein [Bacillota bacterium]NLH59203.1 hypothetical protein [Clostridiales bacterium]